MYLVKKKVGDPRNYGCSDPTNKLKDGLFTYLHALWYVTTYLHMYVQQQNSTYSYLPNDFVGPFNRVGGRFFRNL